MKKNKYIVPITQVFSLFFLWAISSNLLPTMIRQLMKTCELNTFEASFTETAYWLAYFIFPIHVYEKIQLQGRYHFRITSGGRRRIAFLSGSHVERILGLSVYLLYHRYRYVLPRNSRQPVCNCAGSPPNSTSPSEPGTIVQRSRSVHFCNVPEQADSQRHALYTRNPSNGLSGRLAGVHTGGNGCHEISLSGTGLAVSCHSRGICVFQAA